MTTHEFDWTWLQEQAKPFGLDCIGVSDTDLAACEPILQAWLNNGMHGEMEYMAKHGSNRVKPDYLLPGTLSIISVRMNYVPEDFLPIKHPDGLAGCLDTAQSRDKVQISLYARGRDYHKLLRSRLKQFAEHLNEKVALFGFRVAVDSAPTPEVEIARKAGLGWRGKHTLLIHPEAGSLFFLGELFTNLSIKPTEPFTQNHCGTCDACMRVCPTQAIVKEGVVDARRCISYLTIEHQGEIPIDYREAIGTRLYGCDDCQLACPWNKFAKPSVVADFNPRNEFDAPDLLNLIDWTEQDFLQKTEGMAMRRIGYRLFRRNLAIVAGNSRPSSKLLSRTQKAIEEESDPMLQEHWAWALTQLKTRLSLY